MLLSRVMSENGGEVPSDRAALFSGFVRSLLQREICTGKNNPHLAAEELLTKMGRDRLAGLKGYKLRERGKLIPGLAELAYKMQDQRLGLYPRGDGTEPAVGGALCRSGWSVLENLSADLLEELKQALWNRNTNPEADLRARVEVGLALGNLGDHPALERRTVDGCTVLVSPMVTIPAGRYSLGSDENLLPNEGPKTRVELPTFQIARYPVTNGEWRQFMEDGGYDDERWWSWSESEESLAWWRGELTREEDVNVWKSLRALSSAERQRVAKSNFWNRELVVSAEKRAALSEQELEKDLIRDLCTNRCPAILKLR